MKWQFIIRWMYWGNIFIGVGVILEDDYKGITISNLFIGFERKFRR